MGFTVWLLDVGFGFRVSSVGCADKILERGERIDLLVDQSEQLNQEAVTFRRQVGLRFRVCLSGFGVIAATCGFSKGLQNASCPWGNKI